MCFQYSLNKHSLGTEGVPDSILSPGNRVVFATDEDPCLHAAKILVGETGAQPAASANAI